jgi:hypothetical protein
MSSSDDDSSIHDSSNEEDGIDSEQSEDDSSKDNKFDSGGTTHQNNSSMNNKYNWGGTSHQNNNSSSQWTPSVPQAQPQLKTTKPRQKRTSNPRRWGVLPLSIQANYGNKSGCWNNRAGLRELIQNLYLSPWSY